MGHSQENASAGDTVIKDLFLVTTGIMNDYGIFDQQQKFDQLISSIESINQFMPQSDIVVIEAGSTEIPMPKKNVLTGLYIDLHEVYLDPTILNSKHRDPNQHLAKVFGELLIWQKFLSLPKASDRRYRRIHKLSGRYKILDIYAKHDHDAQTIITGTQKIWPTSPHSPGQYGSVIPTRLWSFHTALFWPIHHVWTEMMKFTDEIFRDRQEVKLIESLLHDMLDMYGLPCVELSPLGVQGYFGQDGNFITE